MALTEGQPAAALSIKRIHAQVPITALAIHESHLIAAQDNTLCIYDISSGALIQQRSRRAFTTVNAGQPIHGIHVHPVTGATLLWGASAVAYLPEGWKGETEISGKAKDWVYAGALSVGEEGTAIDFGVVVTAHNDLVPVKLDDASGSLVFGQPISPSRPILYSATLSFLSPTELLVVGGTVFGEILVWKCHLDSTGLCGDMVEMLHTFSGHEGSIFGVTISPAIGPAGRRILASCSDDRTIRLWDISATNANDKVDDGDPRAVRETGFISSSPADASQPLATAMGHSSRIWGVRIVPVKGGDAATRFFVYSFGEDATMQRWCADLDSGKLTHEQTVSLNDGKHLWAHALAEQADGTLCFATGGADSRISIIDEARPGTKPSRSGLTSIDIKDVVRDAPAVSSGSKRAKEIITRYDFLSADEVVAMTSSGRILRGAVGADASQWSIVPVDDQKYADDLGLCYALRSIAPGILALGTTSGNVYLYDKDEGISLVASLDGRVMDLIPVEGSSTFNGTTDVYVQLQGNKPPYYLTININTNILVSKTALTDLDERFVAVSALKARGFIFIGSRHGYLSVMKPQTVDSCTLYPVVYTLRPRSPDAVSCIVEIPSAKPSAPLYVLTTSRDGHYRIYHLEHTSQPLSSPVTLNLLHEVPAPFGPILTGAYFTSTPTSSSPDLILHGFKGKDFLIYNSTQRTDIASIPCGGAHRMHSLYVSPSSPSRLRFAFTRTSLLSIYTQEIVSHRTITPGTHGREIRALSSKGSYLATGSEDTTIRIWLTTGPKEQQPSHDGVAPRPQPKHLMTMKAHNTGIQQLRWLGTSHLLSSGGFEEFFIWRIRRLEGSQYDGVAVMKEACLEDTTGDTDGDLRIMDFDAHWSESDLELPDEDVRKKMVISMVLSDSTIKTYTYSQTEGFILSLKGRYTGACITQVRRLTAVPDGGTEILTGSTDGHLCIWREDLGTKEYQLITATQVHQNTIKAMDMLPDGTGGFIVLTGGDDNAIHLSHIDSKDGSCLLKKQTGFLRAHTASINGVAIIRTTSSYLGVSTSNDQRVKLWDLGREDAGHKVALLKDHYSGVADPGDLEILDDRAGTLAVGGVGMEIWEITGRSVP